MAHKTAVSFIAGTAGHIDHGKTSLIRALTGTDTDRLQEEKLRGISIDLGFAHLRLPNGATVSFIDAPGHERFVKNMLAGASGLRAVLLVVAADESIMPQTREHFHICRLLGIGSGFVVLTKCDIADAEQIARARRDVAELCKDSFLAGSPVLEVSTKTGAGLDSVRNELQRLSELLPAQSSSGIARLTVDRSFTMKGHGTVVTGTLSGGALVNGGSVILHPGGRSLRIRALQVHGRAVERASAGERVAVNLAGIEHAQITRGAMLTTSELVEPSSFLAVELHWLPGHESSASARTEVHLHIGAAEVLAHSRRLTDSLAYLRLNETILAFPGDRFVLRSPSPPDTIAGGVVVDAFPRKRLNRARASDRLNRLLGADPQTRVELLVSEASSGRKLKEIVRATGRPLAEIKQLITSDPKLIMDAAESIVVTKAWVEQQQAAILRWLADFHAQNPNKAGAPVASARQSLSASLASIVFANFAGVRVDGDSVALANHRATYTDRDRQMLAGIEQAFRTAGFAPPPTADVLRAATPDANKGRAMLEALIKGNRLVRVSSDLIFHADVISHIRTSLSKHKGRRFSVPEFKDWMQISRKYAIPLLEYLDHQRVTRRDGDNRVVL